jgi:hypothetical protein
MEKKLLAEACFINSWIESRPSITWSTRERHIGRIILCADLLQRLVRLKPCMHCGFIDEEYEGVALSSCAYAIACNKVPISEVRNDRLTLSFMESSVRNGT